MSMQDNAVASIRLGVEDFKAAEHDEARALSSIRNLTSGLLLLFKVKLQAMSPPGSNEALLKERVAPTQGVDDQVIWVGSGTKTVDVVTIISRLEGLGVDGVEWKLLKALSDIRNEVEHYHSTRPTSVLLETVANCFHLIQQFVPRYLEISPASLLGADIWSFLTEHEAFYGRERKACLESLSQVRWPTDILPGALEHISCPHCKAKLMKALGTSNHSRKRVFTAPVAEQYRSLVMWLTLCSLSDITRTYTSPPRRAERAHWSYVITVNMNHTLSRNSAAPFVGRAPKPPNVGNAGRHLMTMWALRAFIRICCAAIVATCWKWIKENVPNVGWPPSRWSSAPTHAYARSSSIFSASI